MLEKEVLASIFGATKMHQYLFCRQFELVTDHKPLQSLFNESKGINPQASTRIQHLAEKLAAYDYSIRYRPGSENFCADALSRSPLPLTWVVFLCREKFLWQ